MKHHLDVTQLLLALAKFADPSGSPGGTGPTVASRPSMENPTLRPEVSYHFITAIVKQKIEIYSIFQLIPDVSTIRSVLLVPSKAT